LECQPLFRLILNNPQYLQELKTEEFVDQKRNLFNEVNKMRSRIGNSKKYFYGIMLLAFVTLFLAVSYSSPVQAAGYDPSGNTIVADIAEHSSPAVVWIITTYEQESTQGFFRSQPKQERQAQGSGFFFNENGSILTNAHVVAGAKAIDVILKDQKEPISASLVGIDTDLDVAVLKVNLKGKTPYLKLGDSDQSRIGEWVVAIGNPYGLDHTVTLGIISAKGRPLLAGDGANDSQSYENMIQTDAAINPGNSGGPLLDLHGETIGINTAVSTTGQGLSFAIPINSVKNILNELVSTGKVSRPWLGVYLLDLKMVSIRSRAKLNLEQYSDGVLIAPTQDSPAIAAGLQTYDLIVAFNHQPITNSNDLISAIKKQKAGDSVDLTIVRKGNPLSLKVTLAEKPQPR
jgi:serine protease Do